VVDNLTQQALQTIDIPDQSLQQFTGLLARFQLSGYESETRVVVKREENTSTNPTPEETAADLEERIQANPSHIVLFYDLYELYKSDHNPKKARKTLEKLVEEHPDEVYAFYLLGLMRFKQGKFKDAESHFSEALRPRSNLIISEDLMEEIRAYQILSAYLRGDEDRAREMMAESIHIFTEAKINDLPLDANNKRLLLSLK
jgi:tetratricopeptide (TPR) repeat protein